VKKSLRAETEDVEAFVESLREAPQVFVYGVGRSGLVGKAFAIRLVQLGFRVFFIGETVTPIVEPGDLVVMVSNTGETMSAIQTANIARRVGAKVVVVTGSGASKLARTGNLVFALSPGQGPEKAKNAPLGTIFEVCTLVFLDGVVAQLMERTGQGEDDMRQRHAIMV
jgi:6-phospho-3-hexuloisomerase